MKKNAIEKVCTVCQSKYLIRLDRSKASKFCSKVCWQNRRILKQCKHCNEPIKSYHNVSYCSMKCCREAEIGENAHRWIDGKSLERDRARLGSEVKKWRMAVYKRDNYTCQHCGSKSELQAHHIIEWAKDETQRFNVDNGLTLCIDCHGKVHGRDFTKRKNKNCLDCGKKVKCVNTRCHSCSTKKQWETRKLKQ